MGREQARIAKRMEKSPIKECNRIQRKFYPDLFNRFSQTQDPRHQSYVSYTNRVMLGTLYYKGIAGLSSMQEMTREFNDDAKVLGKWLILVDGTELDEGPKQKIKTIWNVPIIKEQIKNLPNTTEVCWKQKFI